MTNEEAIIALKRIRKDWQFTYSYDCEAVEIAIRALKNEQTDGDLISRKAVLDLCKKTEYLEPYHITYPNGDWVKGYDTLKMINYTKLLKLLSAEKTAEWITKWDEEEREERHYCTNCNKYQLFQTKFCSHCGTKMKEGDTE